VGSCLFEFIKGKVENEGCRNFIFYSDSPTGQNRNRMVFGTFLWASSKFQVNIMHRFRKSGHRYSEVDSIHDRIEQESCHKDLFALPEWLDVIMKAKQS